MLKRTVLRKDGSIQTFQEKLKKLSANHKNKYLMVTLTDKVNRRHETLCVHRQVAIVFIPNPNNLPEVNHLRTKNDITIDDLEWSTRSDNQKDAYKKGLIIAKKGTEAIFARKVGKYLDGLIIKEYPLMADAKRDGYCPDSIRQAIKNNWKCGGYNWKYLSDRKWVRRRPEKQKRKIAAIKGGEVINVYENINRVVEDGHDRSNIYKALKNQDITSGGFVWKYLDEKAA